MNFYHFAREIFEIAALLFFFDMILPDTCSLALANLLRLLEFLEVLRVKIHVLGHC